MRPINRYLILYALLFLSLFNKILTSEETISFPSESFKEFKDEQLSTYITINLQNYSEITNENLYISAVSEDNPISPIIISSTSVSHPSIKTSDIYSTNRIGVSHLILGKDLLNETLYLNITCNSYPCSFNLYLKLEEYPTLEIGKSFSYFVKNSKNNFTNFKIESQTALSSSSIINTSSNHILTVTISFSHKKNIDTELLLKLKDNDDNFKIDTNYRMNKRIIYTFIEENLIKNKGGDPENNENYYLLNIYTNDDEYITISVTSKEIFNENDVPLNLIIPNEGGKYSLFRKNLLTEECYSINTNLSDYSNSIIFASISFYTKPVNYYFKKDDKKSDLIIPNKNSLNIIFEKDENNLYKDLCFKLANENDEGIFKIEISESNDIFNKKNIYDPLNTGSIYMKSLPIKGLTYFTYNPSYRIYKQMNFNLKVIKGKMDMFVVRCDTFPDCSYTYEELLEKSKIVGNDKFIKPHIVNDMFSYSDYANENETDLSPFNYKQNLMFVYCNEETKSDVCKFEISFFTDKDRILLLNNDKFYQYQLIKEIDLYQINIPKSSDPFSKIQVILYTFTGDALFQNTSNTKANLTVNVEHDFVSGKDIYEYIPDGIYPIHEREFNIQFQIKGITNTYYEVEYKIIKTNYDETNIENKVFFDEKYTFVSSDITFKDSVKYLPGDDENNKRYFVFQNNRKEENNPYFVQIFSLNCEINVKRDNKIINASESIYQDIISNNEEYYKINEYYIYEINIESIENYGDEETEHQCIIFLSGESLDKTDNATNNINNNKILLTENDPHEIVLTNDIKTYRYLFPYLGNSNDKDSFMLVHINFDSKMSIKVKFYFDESDVKKEETMGRSGQILLSNKLIKKNCKDIEEICNVIIEVNFFNVDKYDNRTWSSPNFQLFISTDNKIPSYIKSGEMRLDSVVRSSPKQYFYTDISKRTQGQIIANTKRGEGILYVRIYKKGTIDRYRTWGDIEIPYEKTTDCLPYDNFTHSVHFEKQHTNKCGYKGCLLLITYKNTYSPSKNNDYLTAFTVLTRLFSADKERQSILEIPLKAYVYGAIEDRLLTYNYFKVHFPEDSDIIDFEMQCETCILYINKNETLPTPENHDLAYYSEGKFGVFGLVTENGKIKDQYYTLRIESPIKASKYVTTYALRVLLPIPSPIENYNLIPVDSDQNANCDLNLKYNDGICYFILYIDDDQNNISDILAHVYTDYDLIDLEINANFIPKKVAEGGVLNDIIKYLPLSKNDSNFSTENEFYQDYLLIDKNKRKNDDYIIYGVSSIYPATVTFLATYYNYKDIVITNSNTVQLLKMEKNTNLELNLGHNNFYLVYLYSLYGTGEIKWLDENGKEKTHKFSEHELFSFSHYIEQNDTRIKSYDNNLAFYLWQNVRESDYFVMNEMDFNMRERFVYTQSIISLKYYCLLPLLKDENKKIIFEDIIFYFELNAPGEVGINKDNNIIIEGTIVNMEIINQIKIEKKDEGIVDSKNNIKTSFDLSTNSGFIVLNKTYCEKIWNNIKNNTNDNAYLYISLKQKNERTIEKDFSGQAIISFRNNKYYVIPSDQVINTKIDIIENGLNYYLYNLQLDGSYDKNKIILDISSNIAINENDLLYSLIDYNNIDDINNDIIKKNSSNIEIDNKTSIYFGGKYHIEFILTEKNAKGIYLCLFNNKTNIKVKDNELKSINALFKYMSYVPSYQSPIYELDNKIDIKQSSKNITIHLNKFKKSEKSISNYPKCEFIIRKVKYENKISNEELSSLAPLQSDYEIFYSYKDEIIIKKDVDIIIPYTRKDNEKFYFSIIANLYEDNEKFVYNTFDSKDIVQIKDEEEKKEEQKEEQKEEKDRASVIVLIVVMIIIVIIIIIVLYLYINKRNMKKNTDKLMQISFNDKKEELTDTNALYKNQNENENQL